MKDMLELLGGACSILGGIGIFGALPLNDLFDPANERTARRAKVAFTASAFLVAGGLITLFNLLVAQ